MSENMNPMDKFITQYQTFRQHEGIANLSEESKVALFGNYCQAVISKLALQQQKENAEKQQAQPKQSGSGRVGCTPRQQGMIMRLVKKGCLEEPNFSALTVKSASRLIDKGLAEERRMNAEADARPAPQPQPQPQKAQGEYGGSYSLV